jgi:hypothetical protein
MAAAWPCRSVAVVSVLVDLALQGPIRRVAVREAIPAATADL